MGQVAQLTDIMAMEIHHANERDERAGERMFALPRVEFVRRDRDVNRLANLTEELRHPGLQVGGILNLDPGRHRIVNKPSTAFLGEQARWHWPVFLEYRYR
jgi:hypothetical protein